ncbi:nucleotidyltransferase family protein (plasmid) [Alicycliphilus denitrificans]|uniref:Nucleotidyltransferase family protein n=1 Tax=Alicycliphilus denitrificans TaxID=179636 RepID=A0A858ZMY2_9BURK|nr:nucleotidyltransferase family protein [Alicycliphilus denitrificans]QKD42079.1 nucleotidyltransferase family protein [Alicycliphilus denitrificans]QKD42107.1 nucleotidyltransferase family protein [Alicycliphilus denitrificans]
MRAAIGMGAVLMAAGAGSRIGRRPKSLLMLDGVPLVERHVRALAQTGLAWVAVALGHHADRIEPLLTDLRPALAPRLDLRWACNPDPDAGPGGSLRCALALLPAGLDAVLVTLADQPLVGVDELRWAMDAWRMRASGIALIQPRFEGQLGHPLVFDASVRQAIMQAPPHTGLREWRRANADQVALLSVTSQRHTLDIDTEADRQALSRTHGVRLEWSADLGY